MCEKLRKKEKKRRKEIKRNRLEIKDLMHKKIICEKNEIADSSQNNSPVIIVVSKVTE